MTAHTQQQPHQPFFLSSFILLDGQTLFLTVISVILFCEPKGIFPI